MAGNAFRVTRFHVLGLETTQRYLLSGGLRRAAIEQRRKFFEAKRDHLYQVEIFYCILLEGARSKTGVGTALARLLRDTEGAIAVLKSQFTNDSM